MTVSFASQNIAFLLPESAPKPANGLRLNELAGTKAATLKMAMQFPATNKEKFLQLETKSCLINSVETFALEC